MPELWQLFNNEQFYCKLNKKSFPMKTTYENEEYFVCDTVEDMTVKLLNYRKAVLLSNFSVFNGQHNEVFKIVRDHYGADSKELFDSSQPKLFCGSCGAPFTQVFLLKLIKPNSKISGVPDKLECCPKCSSQKLTVIYKF